MTIPSIPPLDPKLSESLQKIISQKYPSSSDVQAWSKFIVHKIISRIECISDIANELDDKYDIRTEGINVPKSINDSKLIIVKSISDKFMSCPPFTIQRIAELLADPSHQGYKLTNNTEIFKYVNALRKLFLVSSNTDHFPTPLFESDQQQAKIKTKSHENFKSISIKKFQNTISDEFPMVMIPWLVSKDNDDDEYQKTEVVKDIKSEEKKIDISENDEVDLKTEIEIKNRIDDIDGDDATMVSHANVDKHEFTSKETSSSINATIHTNMNKNENTYTNERLLDAMVVSSPDSKPEATIKVKVNESSKISLESDISRSPRRKREDDDNDDKYDDDVFDNNENINSSPLNSNNDSNLSPSNGNYQLNSQPGVTSSNYNNSNKRPRKNSSLSPLPQDSSSSSSSSLDDQLISSSTTIEIIKSSPNLMKSNKSLEDDLTNDTIFDEFNQSIDNEELRDLNIESDEKIELKNNKNNNNNHDTLNGKGSTDIFDEKLDLNSENILMNDEDALIN